MNVSLSHSTYDLTKIPKHILAEDISLHLDIDIYDTDILSEAVNMNQQEQRIILTTTEIVGYRQESWISGTLAFDGVPVLTFMGKFVEKELHKFVLNEKIYLDLLEYLGTFYKPDGDISYSSQYDDYEQVVPFSI